MSEPLTAVETAGAAPDAALIDAPDTAAEALENTPEPEGEPEPERTFTQKELDEALSKRLQRERRKWERENRPAPQGEQRDDADDYEAQYQRDVAAEVERREAQREQQRALEAYQDREDDARDKYDDFDAVVNDRVPITQVMAAAIHGSEVGPEIAYHLGQNLTEARRISRLSPLLQAKAIGAIEAKLAETPPTPAPRKPSSAPTPITPVAPRGSAPAFDTTDPRSIASMTTEQWIAADRERVAKKLRGS